MKKIGLIGGIGPESSIEYYRLIIKRFQEKLNTKDYPELIINSINMTQMLDYVFNNQLDKLVDFLMERINDLEKTGVDYIAIASNTPHIVFDKLVEKSNTPLISIVEAQKHGINIVIPDNEKQEFIHNKYMTELIFNKIVPETKERLIQFIRELKEKESIEGLILGGTELPLILKQSDFDDIKIFNTTEIHVESIVAKMIEN
jgi:aspartate racemase